MKHTPKEKLDKYTRKILKKEENNKTVQKSIPWLDKVGTKENKYIMWVLNSVNV